MNLAWECSLSSWMFAVTSGGTSWSGGCLEQQMECLRKICVQWHLLPVSILLWVCICVWEMETWRYIPEVLCLLFVQCEWLQFFLRGAHLSALVLAISKGFKLEGSTEHYYTLYTATHNSPQHISQLPIARLRPVIKIKSHHHNVLQERDWSNQEFCQLFTLKFTFLAGRIC